MGDLSIGGLLPQASGVKRKVCCERKSSRQELEKSRRVAHNVDFTFSQNL